MTALVPVHAPERNVRDRVRSALRAAIISGELVPGELYPAPELAARLGVSSTPVREAMLDLVNQGLVVVQPNKGFRIAIMSDRDLDNVTAVRMLVEPPAIRDLTPLIPAADFRRLRRLAGKISATGAAGDLVGYLEADLNFHLTLLAYTGNGYLVDLVSRLRAQTRLGRGRLAGEREIAVSAAEHTELLDLLEARDAAGAEALARRHIGRVRGLWS